MQASGVARIPFPAGLQHGAGVLTEYLRAAVWGSTWCRTPSGGSAGGVRITTRPGQGTTFHLQLPLTLSVIRAVVVDVAGEPYAFPHTRIDRLLRVPQAEVRSA